MTVRILLSVQDLQNGLPHKSIPLQNCLLRLPCPEYRIPPSLFLLSSRLYIKTLLMHFCLMIYFFLLSLLLFLCRIFFHFMKNSVHLFKGRIISGKSVFNICPVCSRKIQRLYSYTHICIFCQL